MTDTQWLTEQAMKMLATAKYYLVAATGKCLGEIPGDHSFTLWAVGDDEDAARQQLTSVITEWLRRRLPR